MKRFADRLRREEGLTLIELIAALSLFSLVAGLIYGVMMFGIQSYERVTMENTLRDESDLLMSAIITEIYTFAPTTIYSSTSSNNGVMDTAIYLQRDNVSGGTEKVKIGISDGELLIKEVPAGTPDNAVTPATSGEDVRTSITSELVPPSSVTLQCSANSLQPCESGLININLSLEVKHGDNSRRLDLESKFGF
ncbi:prepilin-type N-terminal cleavage/methylation domain-containing protein [Paenibacillus sp. FSL R7-0345]|uniref:PulJ/GspJ family protein n=1 Tax=Paenibacillus sp. FSL R7-0345 TaxID=2954535 RepID=UPI00315AF40E